MHRLPGRPEPRAARKARLIAGNRRPVIRPPGVLPASGLPRCAIPVAHQLSAGFVPVRKKGKLPGETLRVTYALEYGTDEIEIHRDAVQPGERVLLVDDLIATGGTAEGAVNLLTGLGAEVVAACFIVDLPDLGGADKVRKLGVPVRTLVSFGGH